MRDKGYRFSLGTGAGEDREGNRRATYVVRCDRARRKKFRHGILPVEAVHYYLYKELPDGIVPWLVACQTMGLPMDSGGMIMRAGDQIITRRDDGTFLVTYSCRLRRDLLKACGLKEKK
jgi:hypothetical protein